MAVNWIVLSSDILSVFQTVLVSIWLVCLCSNGELNLIASRLHTVWAKLH